jgi:ABC-2 type transport system ATP-binding protein
MKQRICVASALLSDPTILLLDEPTNGLDPRGMSEVRDIVKSLKGKERLIFMSSHILSEVSEVCDEVAMIDHGKLVVYDTISNVTAKFSGEGNIVEVGLQHPIDSESIIKKIANIQGVVTAQKKDERNLIIRFTGGLDAQERILSELVKMSIGIISYRPASLELEDAYLKLITATL